MVIGIGISTVSRVNARGPLKVEFSAGGCMGTRVKQRGRLPLIQADKEQESTFHHCQC